MSNQFIDRFDHMNRNADGARLVGNRTGNSLTDPPSGVGGKFVPAPILKLIDSFHQAYIAFDQVQKLQSAIGVFFGNQGTSRKLASTISFLARAASR